MADNHPNGQQQRVLSRSVGGGGMKRRGCCESFYLNEDIIAEIFSRLPTETLIRFKSACKSWESLFSKNRFVKKHLSRINNNTNNNVSRLVFSVNPLRSVDYEAFGHVRELNRPRSCLKKYLFSGAKVVGSCNGLICLDGENRCYVLVNPCTRDMKVLPPLPTNIHLGPFGPLLYGFGYDSTTEDYKVVFGAGPREPWRVGSRGGTSRTTIALFTLKTGCWRIVETLNQVDDFGQGCLVNGALHWPDIEYDYVHLTRLINGAESRILAFDLAKEEFRGVALPKQVTSKGLISPRLGTVGNCLFLYLKSICDPGLLVFDAVTVWVMKEYGVKESWTKLLQVSTNCLPRFQQSCIMDSTFRWSPMCVLENGEVLMISDNEFTLYNAKDEWRDTSVLALNNAVKWPNGFVLDVSHYITIMCRKPVIYAETLVSPVAGSGIEE